MTTTTTTTTTTTRAPRRRRRRRRSRRRTRERVRFRAGSTGVASARRGTTATTTTTTTFSTTTTRRRRRSQPSRDRATRPTRGGAGARRRRPRRRERGESATRRRREHHRARGRERRGDEVNDERDGRVETGVFSCTSKHFFLQTERAARTSGRLQHGKGHQSGSKSGFLARGRDSESNQTKPNHARDSERATGRAPRGRRAASFGGGSRRRGLSFDRFDRGRPVS